MRNSMVFCIKYLMVYCVRLSFGAYVADVHKLLYDVFEAFSVVQNSEALDILQNENFRSVKTNVVVNVLED